MLLEIRIGPGKWKLKYLMQSISKQFKLRGKVHGVPHLTLYGAFPAGQYQVKQIKKLLISIGKKYPFLPFLIDGFDYTESKKGYVIFFKIKPSEEFKKFRKELAKELYKITPSSKPYDKPTDDFLFHITLAYKLTNKEFKKLWSYLQNKEYSLINKILSFIFPKEGKTKRTSLYLPMHALRCTFLNNQSRIICEYDFLQKRLLPRKYSLNRREWKKTLRLFRIKTGMQTQKKNYKKKKSIFLTADQHLGHGNIIHYCTRPFIFSKRPQEMDKVLINNWNNVVSKKDTVYFLGDLTCCHQKLNVTNNYLKKLNGKVVFLEGNHDPEKEYEKYQILEYKKHKFLLVHDSKELPIKWDGWVIHGHTHNNDIKKCPFINGEEKRINIGVELTNYHPVDLDYLISLKLNTIKRMDTIDSKPERK
ncbi:2'-5' RNA ligase family protein [Nanoarchaeota archaeon]